MENKMKILGYVLACIYIALCIGLVIIGHRNISYEGLFTMLIGLGGILVLLYFYNRKFR